MKILTALSLSAALVGGLAFVAPVQAAPLGALRGIEALGAPQVETVQARRRVVRRRGNNNAALAAGILGAAVVGGAIIAESQSRSRRQERAYYYGNGYGYGGGYGAGYAYDDYTPPVYVPRQRYYGGPQYYQPPAYGYQPRHHHRVVRDPAGGTMMDPTYRP